MKSNIHPNQVSFFDSVQDRGTRERERERERGFRLRHTYNDIISVENLLYSWQEFLIGKRKRKDVEAFSIHLTDNIIALHCDLRDKIYKHGPYFAFKINDPKPRDIHKASVRDRLVHHAIYRILYPYFDKKFIYDSYSCRVEKGTHRAIKRFKYFSRKASLNNTRTVWVLKCDIRKFFASIKHEILIDILQKHIKDEEIMNLIRNVVESHRPGLPLGNLTSQLLVNIYLNELDQFVKHELKVNYYIRYADDSVILSGNKKYLEGIVTEIELFLNKILKLKLHQKKQTIKTLSSGIDFLGYVVFPHHIVLRTTTKRRMMKRICQKNLPSYKGLLKHCDGYGLQSCLDQSIERRESY